MKQLSIFRLLWLLESGKSETTEHWILIFSNRTKRHWINLEVDIIIEIVDGDSKPQVQSAIEWAIYLVLDREMKILEMKKKNPSNRNRTGGHLISEAHTIWSMPSTTTVKRSTNWAMLGNCTSMLSNHSIPIKVWDSNGGWFPYRSIVSDLCERGERHRLAFSIHSSCRSTRHSCCF